MKALSRHPKNWLNKLANVATATVSIAAVALVGQRWVQSKSLTGETTGVRSVANWRTIAASGARMGPPDPAVTIVEFSDFGCPACKLAATRFKELRRLHPKDIAVVYRHFPLNAVSREAAIVAECGRRSGVFEAVHDQLFANSDSLAQKPWVEIAQAAGVRDLAAFQSCMTDTTAMRAVWVDTRAADSLLVDRTPSFLVNSQLFVGVPDLRGLDALVARIIARAQ